MGNSNAGARKGAPAIRRYYRDKALCLSTTIICGLLAVRSNSVLYKRPNGRPVM